MKARTSRRGAFLRILRLEAHYFWRYPRLLIAALAVVLIPALYMVIYLASVWDPASKTGALQVGLVNLDRGFVYRDQPFNVGRDLVQRIRAKATFGYRELHEEAAARDLVQKGQLAFALIVPPDFSSNAIPGAQAGAGRLVVFASEGNNLTASSLARHFADDVAREVNQSLNEQRWALVLEEAIGSQQSLARLRAGFAELQEGAQEISVGSQQLVERSRELANASAKLSDGVNELTTGNQSLAGSLRSMYAKRPRNSELNRLDDGAKALAQGAGDLGKGVAELQKGVDDLQQGIVGFKAQAQDNSFVPAPVSAGLNQLGDGVLALGAGAKGLQLGQRKLEAGALDLAAGVASLTTGARSYRAALGEITTRLPDDARLKELGQGAEKASQGAQAISAGAERLAEGVQHLKGGVDLLNASIPTAAKKMDGNAQGLAGSVMPVMEMAAPVRNNGSGFAPNIIPGALWLGASMIAFLFRLRDLPHSVRTAGALSQMTAKIALPAGLVLAQAMALGLCLVWLLEVQVFDITGLVLSLACAALTFLMVVYALTRALGDAGKAVALVLLVVQVSSSGGVLPVELSGGVFAMVSDYLPITWVVKALKASLFGAYGGAWLPDLQVVALLCVLAALAATWLGRWRYVPAAALRPALDL